MTASPTDDLASAERRIQELTKELSRAKGELAEARDQQAATAEILRVISSSPTDLQPVFAEIATSAARLCDAYDALIRQVDGEVLRIVGHHGPIPAAGTLPLTRGLPPARAVLDRRTIHITDLLTETDEFPEGSDRARSLGFRTLLAVPLVHASEAIGVISIRRPEVRPFTDRQIDLLRTFADQAVIAIENTRLFEEVQARNCALADANKQLSETLEQQTATSKILRVISRSPTDVQPVFETTVESAARLCDADRAFIYRFDGKLLRLAASYNASPDLREFVERNPIRPGRHSASGCAALERRAVHILDLRAEPEITYGGRHVDPIGTSLSVPMLKGDTLLGVIFIYRLEVRPFNEKQVALVETFADQAAIAISNVGLFEEVQARTRELTESLEQQTATADVLKVISGSAFDLGPVLQTVVSAAVRLCRADQ